MQLYNFLILIILNFGYLQTCSEDCYLKDRINHHLRGISDKEIELLGNLLQFRSNLKQIFRNVNLIRPVGSRNHEIVQEYIKTFLTNLKWTVEEDRFEMDTVIGRKEFTNIIGTQDRTKSRRLILACHYDSLYKEGFYTSTDSALPCSLILSIAETLTTYYQNNSSQEIDISLQVVFFDGEEAFVSWSPEDSLYGSRHLASLWNQEVDKCGCTKLKRIESLILLDLLGADFPKFLNSNYENRYFESMLMIEKRIRYRGIFKDDLGHPYFQMHSTPLNIQDDHIPFMEKGVPYVHLIPVPFPKVWHKIDDNAGNINWAVSMDIEIILTAFLIEYFHLSNREFNSMYKSLQSNN